MFLPKVVFFGTPKFFVWFKGFDQASVSFWFIIRPSSSIYTVRLTKWSNRCFPTLRFHQRSISLLRKLNRLKTSSSYRRTEFTNIHQNVILCRRQKDGFWNRRIKIYYMQWINDTGYCCQIYFFDSIGASLVFWSFSFSKKNFSF